MRAVRASHHGGPDVLEIVEIPDPPAADGRLLVEVTAAGVNFADVYAREGIGRHASRPPFVLGSEGAGCIISSNESNEGFKPGDRVAWKYAPGSYAERVSVDAAEAVRIPDGVSDDLAAAVLLQGLTAHYLATSTYAVQPGDTVVVHAAAGGVGSLLTQIVRLRGGRVIATVSSPEKEVAARGAGADDVIIYGGSSFAPRVKELTDGAGAAAVYDGVGHSTFDESLACLRRRGCMVLYGAASGQVPPFDLQRLNSGGSLYVTRPTLADYTRDRQEFQARCDDIFSWIAEARLTVHIGKRYPLTQARNAHEDLEGRKTMGKLLLLPG